MTPAAIEIRIGELVLEGVEPHERAAVAGALQRELSEQVARGGVQALLRAGVSPSRVTMTPAVRGSPPGPAQLGADAARAIHARWK